MKLKHAHHTITNPKVESKNAKQSKAKNNQTTNIKEAKKLAFMNSPKPYIHKA